MKIWVLCGGEGDEREVSLSSGEAVYEAFKERGRRVEKLDLRDRKDARAFIGKKEGFAFIALHGGWGEDGRLQAALEMAEMPFSGSRCGACALAMDKAAAIAVFRDRGLPVPEGFEARRPGPGHAPAIPPVGSLLARSGRLVVKPCRSGSTVGVSIIDRAPMLEAALEEAFLHDDRALVEEYIPGREITVTVLERDGTPLCLPVTEICPGEGFYDYGAKYTPGRTDYITPAPMSGAVRAEVERIAIEAFRALGCGAYARVDMRLDGDRPCLLEVNTVPGMTAMSLVPRAARAAGMTFGEFLEAVVERSLTL
ncbi:MAG: D-alanine--D-alanine ligase family protein [Aminivibrio sp.]|jgi:D-alanine-D-alanine ligase